MFLIRKDLCYLCCRVVLLQVRCSYHPFLQPMQLCIPAKGLLSALRSLRWKCLTVDKTWGKCTKKHREKWIEVYLPAGASVYPFLCSSRVHGQLVTVSQPGVCRYGSRTDCCYGWKKNNKGHCEGNANTLCLFPLHSCVLGANKGLDVNLPEVTEGKLVREWSLLSLGWENEKKTCWREHLL